MVFLDGPAGSQVPNSVIDTISDFYRTSNANTHGLFPVSRDTGSIAAAARQKVATFLGARSADSISLGHSMTALNFSLSRALMRGWEPGDEVVITALDHEANRAPWLRLQAAGIVVREVAICSDGTLDAEDLESKVGPKTRLVALTVASNALGTVTDLALARRLASDAGALLLVDAVHAAPHFLLDVEALDVDFLLCSAYKFYGPHVGILYSRPGLLDSIDTDRLRTQSQSAPYRIELGTMNYAAVAGVAAAVDYLASWGTGETLRERLVTAFQRIGEHERKLAESYYTRVLEIPGVTVWGVDFSGRRAPTVSLTLDGVPAVRLAESLGSQGIQVWSGHFYAIRATESLNLEEVGGLLRVGFLMYNQLNEVDRLLKALRVISHDGT